MYYIYTMVRSIFQITPKQLLAFDSHFRPQATSRKLQATSRKRQAASYKRQALDKIK
jgi:hypothetical protein